MPLLIAAQRGWLMEHGRRQETGGWVCKNTNKPINAVSFQHSTPNPCFGPEDFLKGNDGNPINRQVLILYCSACDQRPTELPKDLTADGIIEVVG